MAVQENRQVRSHRAGCAESQRGLKDDILHKRETLELVRAYYRIIDPTIRKQVFELLKSLGPAD